ncbi:hypothetical protein JCM3765_004587 [Sporobolomyces pararoseus]
MTEPGDLLEDIGSRGAWSVSSAKPGFGVEHLRDNDTETFWQSEGSQPHLINVQFSKKQSISEVWIYVDIRVDDSYTPHKISIRAGTFHGDLHEVKWVELQQAKGWQAMVLTGPAGSPDEGPTKRTSQPIRAHLIQIAIISNHMNGKDTHVRGVRVYAPKPLDLEDDLIPFRTVAFTQHETIR